MPEITKRASFYTKGGGVKTFHIETDGAIVNITVGLETRNGRRVTRVDVIPDDESCGGDEEGRIWRIPQGMPGGDARIIRTHEGEKFLPLSPEEY
jgi:hypothetical protein